MSIQKCYLKLFLILLLIVGCKEIPKSPKLGETKEEITFKGIPLGQPGQVEQLIGLCSEHKYNHADAKNSSNKCKPFVKGVYSFVIEYGSMTDAIMQFFIDENGALQKIESKIFARLVPNLVTVISEKYGSPFVEESEAQNGYGNKFPIKIYRWKDIKGNRITIHSLYNEIDMGHISIESGSKVIKDAEKEQRLIKDSKERL